MFARGKQIINRTVIVLIFAILARIHINVCFSPTIHHTAGARWRSALDIRQRVEWLHPALVSYACHMKRKLKAVGLD